MPPFINRRHFVAAATASTLTATAIRTTSADEPADADKSPRILKAVKYHMVAEDLSPADKLKLLKDLGYDGVEPRAQLKPDKAEEVRQLRAASEKLDFPIHGVVNSSNPDIAAAIDQAEYLGATSVLHVVRYNRDIGYLQNYRETQDIIRKAVAHAEQKQIHILIENVWASFLIEPLGMARYVDEIDSPFVKVYFDIGNVVRWGWPQHWIEVLGARIQKLDVKEFDLNVAMNEGLRKGFGMPLGEGSIDWKKVRAELLKLDYRGWATAEVPGGDRQRLADIKSQMERVFDFNAAH
jgi:hexulose-6-phosphate isomerase